MQPFPGAAGKWQVSTGGGQTAIWRGDGRELFYIAPGGKIMSVEIKPGKAFEAGTPRPLFQARMKNYVGHQYGVTPGGDRFLVNVTEQESFVPITVAVNWPAGVAR